MKAWQRAFTSAIVTLALPASPALAKRGHKRHKSEAVQRAPAVQQSGYDLAGGGPALAAGAATARDLPQRSVRNRAAAPAEPTVDMWANLPNPSMSLRAGKRGPVIELGAFSGDMRPLRSDNLAYDDGTVAHVTMAWRF